MKVLTGFFSYSFFIAFCALALSWQTVYLFNFNPTIVTFILIFFSTLGAYNLYWFLCRLVPKFLQHRRLEFSDLPLIHMLLIAGSGAFILTSLIRGQRLIPDFAISSLLTFAYCMHLFPASVVSRLMHRYPFVKMFLLASTWTIATSLLPASGHTRLLGLSFWLFLGIRMLFLFMLTVIFEKKDDPDGMKDLFHLKCIRMSLMLSVALIYLFWRETGMNVQSLVLFASALSAMAAFFLSFRWNGFWFFYLVVDGLMILSPILSLLGTI